MFVSQIQRTTDWWATLCILASISGSSVRALRTLIATSCTPCQCMVISLGSKVANLAITGILTPRAFPDISKTAMCAGMFPLARDLPREIKKMVRIIPRICTISVGFTVSSLPRIRKYYWLIVIEPGGGNDNSWSGIPFSCMSCKKTVLEERRLGLGLRSAISCNP